MTTGKIVIVGAELGGLVAALALHQQGFAVEVHEQAPVLGEVGAGLTLSRGAQSVFRALGIMDAVAAAACPAAQFPFLHYRTGAVLSGTLDFGAGEPDDGTADVGRADLHAVLVAALRQQAPDSLRLGHEIVDITETTVGVQARFAYGSVAHGDALVAVDGVRSAGRRLLWGADAPRFTGQIAFRFLVAREDAAPFMSFGRGAVLLGPGRTFNRYTLRGGALDNCVGIARHEGWTDDGWHPDIIGLIGQARALIKWGLFDRAPMPCWSRGRTTLLGDAAHPMLPFLAMGAAMAIEDGMILARCFAAEAEVAAAFAQYESTRRPRTALLHAKSIEQGLLTQARDPENYDAGAAPASDPAIVAFDPVTAPI